MWQTALLCSTAARSWSPAASRRCFPHPATPTRNPCSAAALFLLFPMVDHFRVALYSIVLAIGFLVGLEIPLLMRILREGFDFREVVSTVLTFDYVGALAASLLFPLLLVPYRSEEHPSELQSLMRISYAVFCLKKKNITKTISS